MSNIQLKRQARARLAQDKPSNVACFAVIGSALFAVCLLINQTIPGSQFSHRSSPFYWAILLPFAWWAINLGYYEPKVTWTLVPAILIAPSIALACLLSAALRDKELLFPLGVALLCLALSGVAAVSYRRSLLRRERTSRTSGRSRPSRQA